MKITSTKHQYSPYGEIWWGTAIEGDDRLEWFYEPGNRVELRREMDDTGYWLIVPEPGATAENAILEAVRARAS